MTENMREEFKIHRAKLAARLIQGEDWAGAYLMADELVSWQSFEAAWNASREALVIQLPEKCEYADSRSDYAKGHRQGKRDVVDSIEAAGLKVKP